MVPSLLFYHRAGYESPNQFAELLLTQSTAEIQNEYPVGVFETTLLLRTDKVRIDFGGGELFWLGVFLVWRNYKTAESLHYIYQHEQEHIRDRFLFG
jgi:hypothetical protein